MENFIKKDILEIIQMIPSDFINSIINKRSRIIMVIITKNELTTRDWIFGIKMNSVFVTKVNNIVYDITLTNDSNYINEKDDWSFIEIADPFNHKYMDFKIFYK